MLPPSRERLTALIRTEVRGSHLTQRRVAGLAEISEKHLSEILNGHTLPSLDVADRILAVLGRELVLVSRVAMRPARRAVASQAIPAGSSGKVHI